MLSALSDMKITNNIVSELKNSEIDTSYDKLKTKITPLDRNS